MINNNKIGIGYIRVSSKQQVREGVSLEVQEKEVRNLLEKNGCREIRIYADEGKSGRYLEGRDNFIEAIKFAVEFKVDYFGCYDTSRFARNVEDSTKYYKALKANGTKFICVTAKFEDTPEGDLIFSIMATFDQYLSAKSGAKIKESIKELHAKGYFPHTAPLGYKNIRREDGKSDIIVHRKYGHILQKALKGYANGSIESEREFAEFLQDRGFNHPWLNPNSKRIHAQLASRIINKRFYCGYFWDNDRHVWQKHNYPSLITQKEYDLIQKRLQGKKKQKNGYKKLNSDYPLRSIAYCPLCGRKLFGYPTRGNGGIFKYYDCKTKGCMRATQIRSVHDLFEDELVRLTPQKNTLDLLVELYKRRLSRDSGALEQEKLSMQRHLRNLDRRKNVIKTSICKVNNETLQREFENDFQKITGEIDKLQTKIKEFDKPEEDCEPLVEEARDVLENPLETWKGADIVFQTWYQRWLFPKGLEYHPKTGLQTREICLTYGTLRELGYKKANVVELLSSWTFTGTECNSFVEMDIDSSNNLYGACGKYVKKFDSNGNFQLQWLVATNWTMAITIDSNNYVYVSEGSITATPRRIRKYNTSGTHILSWITPGNIRHLAADNSNNVFAADQTNYRILKYNSSGSLLGTFGSYGYQLGQIADGNGAKLAITADNNIYVGDGATGPGRIQVFSSDFSLSQIWAAWGYADDTLNKPNHATFDEDNNRILVADSGNNKIKVFRLDGSYISTFGDYGTDPGMFDYPVGISISPLNEIFVTDPGNSRIQIFNKNFEYQREIGGTYNCTPSLPGEFCWPMTNVMFDSQNNVYVSDTYNNQIQVFDYDGNFLKFITPAGSSTPNFDETYQMVIDALDNLFVVDASNNRVVKFDSDGNYLSEFGTYGAGPGEFDYPKGLAIDEYENLYVSDWGRVQIFNNSFEYFDTMGNLDLMFDEENFASTPLLSITGNKFISTDYYRSNRVQIFSFPEIVLTLDSDLSIPDTGITLGEGQNYTFKLTLDSPPTNDVQVIFFLSQPDSRILLSQTTFSFTSTNWNIPQLLTIELVNDSSEQGSEILTTYLQTTVTSTDVGYHGYELAPIALFLYDDDEEQKELIDTGNQLFQSMLSGLAIIIWSRKSLFKAII
ncbi:MAG: recombinase family protein [Candidatus Dojkabacteria bacterium]|nr:recombinase family protein [Candidatus Dojkabacteria bacterium]